MAKAARSNWDREPFEVDAPEVPAAAPPPALLRAKHYQPRPKLTPASVSPRRVRGATSTVHVRLGPVESVSTVSTHPIANLKAIIQKLLTDGAALGGDAPAMGERWVHEYLAADVVLRDRLGDALIAQCVRTLVTRALADPAI